MAFIETKRGDKTVFRVRWNYRPDPATGKEVYEQREFSNRKVAAKFHREVTPVDTADTENITVAQLAAVWQQSHVQHLAKRTQKDYREQLTLRILPHLGRVKVSRLTAGTVAKWRDQLTVEERTVRRRQRNAAGRLVTVAVLERISPATANKSLAALKAMIKWGRSEGLHHCRTVDDVLPMKAPPPAPANPYPPATVERIANACELLRDETLVYLAAYSGLRWSELCALEWSDIDWEAETLDVDRAMDIDFTTSLPKRDKQRAGVPILTPGMEALKRWREHAPDGVSLVFPDEKGGPLRSNWYRHDRTMPDKVTAEDRNLGRIRKACGIDFEPHQLRDTYASILIQTTGIGEAEITLWLGHTSIQTTIAKYGKLFARRKSSLAKLANAALAGL